ncbi:uncharacterized protein LOC125757833 [Rhipicephalus sanguineus]|uniref:uncharacterized protein LOC125757833 n=1 Tax=Rhipicephalus sanguineus TaxID=34632 RepID=UPI0020C1CBD7|nr:uncharacterized protein LOC125757833 [Rhipicephalus sanguineus]
MGRCCVPNCRGNYDGVPKVRLFSFPKDHRRIKWKRAIRREDVDIDTLRHPKVCELHFKAAYLRTTTSYTYSNRRTIEVPMSLTRLTEDAVPTMFPNSCAYLSDCAPVREEPDSKRKRREADQLQKVIQMSLSSHEEDERKNRVASFEQLVSQLSELKLSDYWIVSSTEAAIMFLHIQSNTLPPEVERSVVVSDALRISAYWKKMKMFIDDVPIPEKLEDIRCLQTILESVEHFNAPDNFACVKMRPPQPRSNQRLSGQQPSAITIVPHWSLLPCKKYSMFDMHSGPADTMFTATHSKLQAINQYGSA